MYTKIKNKLLFLVIFLSLSFGEKVLAQPRCEGEIKAGVCLPTDTGLSNAPIADILSNLMTWLLSIFGVLAIIAFVVSGIQYLTAAGDDHQIETAKNNMKYSVIGIIVAFSGLVILVAVNQALILNSGF